MTVYDYFNAHPELAAWVIVLIALVLLALLGVVFFLAMRVRQLGPLKLATDGAGDAPPPVSYDIVFAYSEYVSKLRAWEENRYEDARKQARLETRRTVDAHIAKLRTINHEVYNLSQGRAALDATDKAFAVTTNGGLRSALIRELMEIYEINHLREMSREVYQDTMNAHFDRIAGIQRGILMGDWLHQDYAYDYFESYLEKHAHAFKEAFMRLMAFFRDQSESKSEIQAAAREKLLAARKAIRETGALPDGCEDDLLC